jgi:hypothetical protein
MSTEPLHVILQPSVGGPIKWYEKGERAREVMEQFPDFTFSHLEWESHAWPGGYEIHYIAYDGGVLCHVCANKELERTIDPDDAQFFIVAEDIHYEGPAIQCDHCNRNIESAYGETDEDVLSEYAVERNAAGYYLVPVWEGNTCHHMQVEDKGEAANMLRAQR